MSPKRGTVTPPPPIPPPGFHDGSMPDTTRWLLERVIVGVVVLVGVVVAVAIAMARDEEQTSALLADGRVRLEAADAPTPGPFVEHDAGADVGVPAVDRSEPPRLTGRTTTGLSGLLASGDEAGLYGSGAGDPLCDAAALLSFLTDPVNTARARAWAGVLGITIEDIPGYVGRLTAVRLRYDTRVTDHDFAARSARPFQSVLQAGTSVLVDRRGVPRVRCLPGSPLTEPQPVGRDLNDQRAFDVEALAANPQSAWEGFDPAQVVRVEPGDEVEVFVVADLRTGARSEQLAGSR